MNDYGTTLRKHRRLAILRFLKECDGYAANSSIIRDVVNGVGVTSTTDQVTTELAWLREQGLMVLAYSMHEGSNVIRRALEAGANGYVTKREPAQALLDAIAAVLAGQRHLSPRAAAVLKELSPLDALSGQQQQIYRHLGQGISNEGIAQRMNISVRTLESYFVRILDKLGLPGVKELRRQAIRDAVGTEPGVDAKA